MPQSCSRRCLVGAAAVLVLGRASGARAKDGYPRKPVTVIVPYAPGGQGDVFARLVGEPLARALGQPVLVDNRPGASGAVGSRLAVRAPADGYTLLMGQTGEIAINGAAMRNPGYHALRDLRAVALVGDAPLVLAVPAASPWQSLADLIQAARAQPGSVAYASSGTATPGHLAAAELAARTGTQMTHIPYKGAGQAITDLIGAQVQFFFASASSIIGHVKGGKVRALAVSKPAHVPALSAALPSGVPAVSDTMPGFAFSLWGGYFAPRGTPDAVVERLSGEINRIIAAGPLRERLEAEGSVVKPGTPQGFDAFVRAEVQKYARQVLAAGVMLES